MPKYTLRACPVCGMAGTKPCVKGKYGSELWKKQFPFSPGHQIRWKINKKEA